MKPLIPDEALTQNIAVLGKNGSGKTYATKSAIVERLLGDGRRVGIIDPTGAWWGLRSSRDGNGAGFPILVLGGDHGDLPLPPLGGAAVARLLAVQGVNLVADTSQLTVGERTRWFTDFAGTLYRTNKTPLHLVIDEAHNFAPQGKVPDPDAGKMLHAASTLASQGRSRGIRLTMITQRPQKLHKDSLTSADMLIAMRVIHPLDRGAVADWINGCGDPAKGKEVLDSLANLKRGEGWAWYPEGGFLQRMTFPPIKTFDSSATPMDGAPIASPKGAAEIDLTEIKAAMEDAVKEAEANDPKLLRARIAELEREARKPRELAVDTDALEREYRRGKIDGYGEGIKVLAPIAERLAEPLAVATAALDELRKAGAVWATRGPSKEPEAPRCTSVAMATASSGNGALPKGERAILIALAQYQGGCARDQLSILTGYKRSSRDAYIQRLRERGYAITVGEAVTATDAGIAALGDDYEPLPTGAALLAHWLERLPPGEATILRLVASKYPSHADREWLSRSSDYQRSSRDAYIQRLRSRKLVIPSARGEVVASDVLFD